LESLVAPFLKTPILVPVTLLPIINPLSTAPFFVAPDHVERPRRAARHRAVTQAVPG